MRPIPFMRWGFALASGLLFLLAEGRVSADEPTAIEELRARIEALERQNQELQKSLKTSPSPAENNLQAPDVLPQAMGSSAQVQEPKREPSEWFEIGKQLDLRARWDNGMWFLESADRAFRIHVGGRSQFDVIWLDGDNSIQFGRGGVGRVLDGVNLRRARLEVDGTVYDTIDFWCEYDFLNTFNIDPATPATVATVANTPAPTDVWVTLTHLPLIGNLRIGNQKPPIAFEHMTSSRFLNFLERSLAFDAFVELQDNGFRPGIQAFNWVLEERATWALGVFVPSRNVFGWNQGDNEVEVTGRITGLPIYMNDGRCLVHLGLGGSWSKPDDGLERYRARTLLRNGPPTLQPILAEVRALASNQELLVPEFIVVWGPYQFGAEYYASWLQDSRSGTAPANARPNLGTTFYQGFYVESLYFLTGEHRIYNRRAAENRRIASFDRVIPNENFFFVEREDCRLGLGCGGWQIGARYSYIDLQDKGLGLGIAQDVTLGLNWFWNANMKLQMNYVVEHRDVAAPNTANGWIHGFGTRLAWDF